MPSTTDLMLRSVLERVSKHATTPLQRSSQAADYPVRRSRPTAPIRAALLTSRCIEHPIAAGADARGRTAVWRFGAAGHTRSLDPVGAVVDLGRRALHGGASS